MQAANDNFPKGESIRFKVEPRLVPPNKAARRLHLTLIEFQSKLPSLINHGFPYPCLITGYFDLIAIDHWLDGIAGLSSSEEAFPASTLDKAISDRIARL
jgi:hypothetical protein